MRFLTALLVYIMILAPAAGCDVESSVPDGEALVARARGAWRDNWHAVWQIEWHDAPVSGPLVAEMWHADDGRVRIETLEASTADLSSLILVDDGKISWLYDARYRDARLNTSRDHPEAESAESVRIPLASDALDVIDWLFLNMDDATVVVSGRDILESGAAIRSDITLPSGDRAVLWVQDETGLPSRVELYSATWGKVHLTARSISIPEQLHPGLFTSSH
jgi:outer membrane lipoprotein-sorting protein